jgi:Protein of unknown function (DUF433)
MGGEPVITGTRLPVRAVAERIKRGDTMADLCEDYPDIPRGAFEATRSTRNPTASEADSLGPGGILDRVPLQPRKGSGWQSPIPGLAP